MGGRGCIFVHRQQYDNIIVPPDELRAVNWILLSLSAQRADIQFPNIIASYTNAYFPFHNFHCVPFIKARVLFLLNKLIFPFCFFAPSLPFAFLNMMVCPCPCLCVYVRVISVIVAVAVAFIGIRYFCLHRAYYKFILCVKHAANSFCVNFIRLIAWELEVLQVSGSRCNAVCFLFVCFLFVKSKSKTSELKVQKYT